MNFRLTNASRALATGVAAIALIAAGCGGSDDETTASSSDAPTKDEFIAQADQICTETGTAINAEVEEQFGTEAPSEDVMVGFFADVTIPGLAEQFEELDALTPPEGQEDEVQAMIDAGNEAVAESEKDPSLLLVFSGAPTPFDEFSQLAQDFGLQVCGGGEPDAGKPVG